MDTFYPSVMPVASQTTLSAARTSLQEEVGYGFSWSNWSRVLPAMADLFGC